MKAHLAGAASSIRLTERGLANIGQLHSDVTDSIDLVQGTNFPPHSPNW